MTTLEYFKIVNFALALLTLPTSLYIIIRLWRDGKFINTKNTEQRKLNSFLRVLFGGIAFGAFLNALYTTASYLAVPFYVENHAVLASGRNTIVNAAFAFATWGIALLQKRNHN